MFAFLLVFGILAGILVFGLCLWMLVRTVFVVLSGWNNLALRYRAPRPPAGWQWFGQTVKVGAVRYRRCMRVAALPDGLYLGEAGLMRHPPLRVPWSEMHSPYNTTVYGRPYVGVCVGNPPAGTLEFPRDLYGAMYAAMRPR